MFQFSAFVLESRNQRLFDSFTGLIAAFHAITLLTPRHPPHALSSLTTMILDSPPPPHSPGRTGLAKQRRLHSNRQACPSTAPTMFSQPEGRKNESRSATQAKRLPFPKSFLFLTQSHFYPSHSPCGLRSEQKWTHRIFKMPLLLTTKLSKNKTPQSQHHANSAVTTYGLKQNRNIRCCFKP